MSRTGHSYPPRNQNVALLSPGSVKSSLQNAFLICRNLEKYFRISSYVNMSTRVPILLLLLYMLESTSSLIQYQFFKCSPDATSE